MANQWLRLWNDMPNDPKWRTISRVSGRPIPEVISVYLHLLVCASNAMKRGVTQGWSSEDVATALDMETASVELILSAMQGRVMEGDKLTGWEKRQPKREDSSSERVREFRKRNVTQCNAPDKDKDKKEEPPLPPKGLNRASALEQRFSEFWSAYPKKKSRGDAVKAWNKIKPDEQLHDRILRAIERAKTSADWTKDNGQFIPYPASWLNAQGWEDEIGNVVQFGYGAGGI